MSVNSLCKATTNPPLHFTPSPLYAETSSCPQKQNNVREYFQTETKFSFIRMLRPFLRYPLLHTERAFIHISKMLDIQSMILAQGVMVLKLEDLQIKIIKALRK